MSMLYSELSVYVMSDAERLAFESIGQARHYRFYVTDGGTGHAAFRSEDGFRRWMDKLHLSVDGDLAEGNDYRINGAYRILTVPDRELVRHLPQIAIMQNGGMVRAYREVKETETAVYYVTNYTEQFKFDYSHAVGQRYIQRFHLTP